MSIALWHEVELLKERVAELERQLEHERTVNRQPERIEQPKPRGRKAA